MTIIFSDIVVWLIIGALAGSLAGMLVTGTWKGFGRWTSLGVGLVGALIGGVIFRLFNLWPSAAAVSISLRDVMAALFGSLLFLVALWFVKRGR